MTKRQRPVPIYYGIRIYLFSTLLYLFLVMPIVGILFLKYAPQWFPNNDDTSQVQFQPIRQSPLHIDFNAQESKDSVILNISEFFPDSTKAVFDSIQNMNDSLSVPSNDEANSQSSSENNFGETIIILFKLLLLSFILGFAFNIPFKIYFKKKRKGKPIQEKLYNYCKKFLLVSPIINSSILLLAYGITLGYMIFTLMFGNDFDDITRRFYQQFFFISLVSTVLTVFFVFYWQKHRVHILYIEYIFPKDELRKRIFNVKVGRIRNRLWVSSGMTTLLPLIIVIFYLFLSVTMVKELTIDDFTEEQMNILFGKYMSVISQSNAADLLADLFYVNAFDSVLMFAGIFTGIFISLIYILFFIRWTTEDIVGPVKELLANMQRTGQGELDQFSIVRTNDEIGELTEGFNDMSQKLKEYILNISRINQANSRFVPRQFLEFLGKDSIADINLGDQVQKEMTILFSDIREFTTISEEMTPKENFNFLNNYLGYMEPVISANKGFIDKFMGDSIMALFSDQAEDAINAAIEMRIKLTEFNQVISQFGKPAIDSGIGIHTGILMLGIVGGEGRMDGTVISDSVNLAARLEGLTKYYGNSIIISEDTLIKLNDPSQYNFRFIDIVKVKGKREAVYIFEILDGEPAHIKNLKVETKPQFSKALQHYKNKEFDKALALFNEVYKLNPEDKASGLYIKRCENFVTNGVPENWDGIEVLQNK